MNLFLSFDNKVRKTVLPVAVQNIIESFPGSANKNVFKLCQYGRDRTLPASKLKQTHYRFLEKGGFGFSIVHRKMRRGNFWQTFSLKKKQFNFEVLNSLLDSVELLTGTASLSNFVLHS